MASPFVITAHLQLQGPGNLSGVMANVQRQLNAAGGTINVNSAASTAGVAKLTSGLAATQSALAAARTQTAALNATLNATVSVTSSGAAALEHFAAQAGLAARRFLSFSVAAGAMVQAFQGIKAGVSAAVAFETAMNKVAQISGDTQDQIAAVRGEVTRLATTLGVSSQALADVAVTLKQTGMSAEQVRSGLAAIALTDLAPNFDSMRQTTEGLIASWRQFNLSSKEFEGTLASMNAVAGGFAVEARDLITAVQKAGGAFASVAGDAKTGQDALSEFMGLFTSVRATTRESADTIATGLRTIFTRLQRADTVEALKDLNINLRYTADEARSLGNVDLTNQFVGAYEAVKRLSEGLAGLRQTDPRYAQVMEQLGGYRQISKSLPLLQQFETAQQAVNVAVAGQLSLQTAAERRQETLANKVSVLKEEYLALFRQLADSKGFKDLAESLIKVASGFGEILKFASPLLPVLTALATVKIAANLGGVMTSFGRNLVAAPGTPSGTGPVRRAGGGWVPGSGDGDTVPALLTPGEFVISKRSAALLGSGTLHRLNAVGRYAQGGFVQRFKKGGKVDPSTATYEYGDYKDNPAVAQAAAQAAAAAKVTLTNATRVLLEIGKAGPVFKGLADQAAEVGKKATSGGATAGNPWKGVKTEELLARMTPQQTALYQAREGLIDRAIRKVAGGRDETGELQKVGSRALARAVLTTTKEGDDFKPGRFIERAVFSRVSDLGKWGDRAHAASGADLLDAGSSRDPAAATAAMRREERRLVEQAVGGPLNLSATRKGAANKNDLTALAKQLGVKFSKGASEDDKIASLAQAIKSRLAADQAATPAVKSAGGGGVATAPAMTPEQQEAARYQMKLQAMSRRQGQEVPASQLDPKDAASYRKELLARVKGGNLSADDARTMASDVLTPKQYRLFEKRLAYSGPHPYPEDEARYQDRLRQMREQGGRPPRTNPDDAALLLRKELFSRVKAGAMTADDAVKQATGVLSPAQMATFARRLQPYTSVDQTAAYLASASQNPAGTVPLRQQALPGKDDLALQLRKNLLDQIRGGTVTPDAARKQLEGVLSSVQMRTFEKQAAQAVYDQTRLAEKAATKKDVEQARKGQELQRRQDRIARSGAVGGVDNPFDPLAVRRQLLEQVSGGQMTADQALAAAKGFSPAQMALFRRQLDHAGGTAGINLVEQDKEGRLTGGLLKRQVDADVAARVKRLGGDEQVSGMTRDQLTADATARQSASLQREVYSAQKRLLQAMYPQMAATELHRKATEDAAAALSGQAKVVRDLNGRVLATEATYKAAQARGVAAPGAGGFAYTVGGVMSSVGNAFGRASEGLSRINDRLLGSPIGGLFNRGVGTGLLLGAPLLAGQLDRAAGSAEQAAASGGGSFRGLRATSGGLMGAVTGGAIGAAIGGPFAAITGTAGALIGGAMGVYGALKDAENDIRQVKINQALNEVGDALAVAANVGIGQTSPTMARELQNQLTSYRAERTGENREKATSWWSGFNLDAYQKLQNSSLRRDLGGQLPAISQSLQREADRLGRAGVGEKVDDLAKRLREGGNGLNRELMQTAADLRRVPLAQIMSELRKNILSGQQAAERERKAFAGRMAEERNVNDFGRLVLALQQAADGLDELRRHAAALADVFDGTVSASRVSLGADRLQQLGRQDRGALDPLRTVAAVGGENGRRLLAAGEQVDALARVLPDVIAQTVGSAHGTVQGSDISTSVERQLRERLGDSPATRGAIASVIHKLNEEVGDNKGGPKNLFDQVQTDVSAFTARLLQPQADPVKDAGTKAAKLLEEQGNKLAEGLAQTAAQVRRIGETYDQLAAQQVASYRQRVEFASRESGRRDSDLLFRAPISFLDYGFDARQRRLTGDNGPTAFDPAAIGRRLAATQARLTPALDREQQAAQSGDQVAYRQAAEEVVRLKTQAANLQQALKHLADASTRNAAIQERLSRIQQEKDGRLGLVERYATASVEERVRLNRGFMLAARANERGTLDGMADDDVRAVFESLHAAGSATLTGFKGAPRADDLLNNLKYNSFGGAARLPAGMAAEERNLQQEAVKRSATAEEAVAALAKAQESASQAFFRDQLQMQNQFFTRLEAMLRVDAITAKENRKSELTVQDNRNTKLKEQAKVLGGIGIGSDDQLAAAKRSLGDIESFATAQSTIAAQYKAYEDSFGRGKLAKAFDDKLGVDKFGPRELNVGWMTRMFGGQASPATTDRVRDFLKSNFDSLDDKQVDRIMQRWGGLVQNEVPTYARRTGSTDFESIRQQFRTLLDQAVRDELTGGSKVRGADGKLTNTTLSEAIETRNRFQAKLQGQGFNVDGLTSLTSQPDGLKRLKEALDAFTGDTKLGTLDAAAAKTAAELATLTAELQRLKGVVAPGGQAPPVAPPAAPAGQPDHLAVGGHVSSHPGGPRGSDTVPAWLTPGEFVVRREAAQANMDLLHRINRAGGPVFLASGGAVDDSLSPDEMKSLRSRLLDYYRRLGMDAPENDGVRLDTFGRSRDREANQQGKVYRPRAGTYEDALFRMPMAVVRRFEAENPEEVARLRRGIRRAPEQLGMPTAEPEKLGMPKVAPEQLGMPTAVEEEPAPPGVDLQSLNADYRFLATVDPYGAAGMLLAKRQAVDLMTARQKVMGRRDGDRYARFGGLSRFEEMERDSAVSNVVAGRHWAGQVANFNLRSAYASAQPRPGQEGQFSVAAGVLGRQAAANNEFARSDYLYHDYLRRRNGAMVLDERTRRDPLRFFADGGRVPGGGMADSVPALLTPGEYVLSQSAVARLGADTVQRFNAGGPVGRPRHLSDGGPVTADGGNVSGRAGGVGAEGAAAMNQLAAALHLFVQQAGGFDQAASQLTQVVTAFGGHATALGEAIAGMPRSITLQGQHTVTVTLNGAEVLGKLTPDIQALVGREVGKAMRRVFREQMPDAGVNVD